MDNKNRVLAYNKALDLTDSELADISGGAASFTFHLTGKITGATPGYTDGQTDQVWD